MREVRTVTVLGGNGTIGRAVSAIFASFGGARVYMVGRDGSRLSVARRDAAASVRAGTVARDLHVRTYEDLEGCVSVSDLVFEAVAEDMAVKSRVLAAAARWLPEDALICSGTSGLSVEAMARALPEGARGRFLGVHFFNPPYAMRLCEVVPARACEGSTVDGLCHYLEGALRREVVVLRDGPAFLANRVGFQFIASALRLAERFSDRGGIAYVDSLFGPFTGRAMAPVATADFVGFDVTAAVADNVVANADDWARGSFVLPAYCRELVARGLLGRKAGRGAYATEPLDDGTRRRLCYDVGTGRYVRFEKVDLPFRDRMIASLRVGDYEGAARALVEDGSADARTCLAQLVEYVLYGVSISTEVGRSVHDADVAMAEGFGWCPPLALADALSLAGDFGDLARGLASEGLVRCPDAGEVASRIERSRYDFRPYLRARA